MKLTAPRTVWAESGDPQSLRAQLRANLSVDVAIIGAGFTGLWTAYYLKKIAPNLDISILEANHVGFGASGRNGGWCSTLFPASTSKLTKNFGPIAARKMYDAMVANLAEIDRVCRAEQIDCDWTQGGTLVVARNEVQRTRAQAEVAEHLANGLPESDLIYLSADEVIEKANFTEALGGTFTPNCAAINPLKLVTGLARVLESLGVQIFENTRVLKFSANEVVAETATVQAKYVVRATEGYTPNLAQNRRTIAPVYSLMIATEPLSEQIWSEIGLSGRQTFSDYRNLVIYGQRTADNRIAFGGRGAPYHFGSAINSGFDQNLHVHTLLQQTLAELFPALKDVQITHTWGGPLGVTRDWMASCGLDPKTGLAWAGGYVGDGVNTSSLAGQTLAHLITGTDSELTSLPWVNYRCRQWEPEPLRWLGVNTALWAVKHADRKEDTSGKQSRILDLVNRVTSG